MIQIDELFSTPARRRREVLRLSAGKGLETAISIAKAGEPALLSDARGGPRTLSGVPGFTTAKGIPLYIADMLALPSPEQPKSSTPSTRCLESLPASM